MKRVIAGLVLQMSLSSLALASGADRNPILCVRDMGPWGFASKCTCVEGYTYKKELGYCVETATWDPKPVTVEGILRTEVVAAGGETTGFGVEVDGQITDLVLKTVDKQGFKDYDGRTIAVQGDSVVLPAIEPHGDKGWVAIIVKDIHIVK